jgi:hypothetical protein
VKPEETAADERGAIGVTGAVFGLVVVALMGLVVFHGNSLGALSRTREVADNAARVGAQEVDVEHLLTTGQLRIDGDAAARAAAELVALDGVTRLESVQVEGDTVTVTVSQAVDPILGVGTPRVFTATESATALRGVSAVIE